MDPDEAPACVPPSVGSSLPQSDLCPPSPMPSSGRRRAIGHLSNLRDGWAFSGWKAKTEKMAKDRQKVPLEPRPSPHLPYSNCIPFRLLPPELWFSHRTVLLMLCGRCVQVFKSLGRIKHRALATGFNGWLHNVQETRRQLQLVERAVRHMVHRVIAASLYTWCGLSIACAARGRERYMEEREPVSSASDAVSFSLKMGWGSADRAAACAAASAGSLGCTQSSSTRGRS